MFQVEEFVNFPVVNNKFNYYLSLHQRDGFHHFEKPSYSKSRIELMRVCKSHNLQLQQGW